MESLKLSENEFVKLSNDVSNIKKRLATIERRLERIEIALMCSYAAPKRHQKPAIEPLKLDKKTRDNIAIT